MERYRHERNAVAITFGLVAILAAVLGGCAHSPPDKLREGLTFAKGTYLALDKGYSTLDEQTQQEFVSRATVASQHGDLAAWEEADRQLAEWQTMQQTILKGEADLAALIAAGDALVPLVESGAAHVKEVDTWLSQVLAAGTRLKQLIDDVRARHAAPSSPSVGGAP